MKGARIVKFTAQIEGRDSILEMRRAVSSIELMLHEEVGLRALEEEVRDELIRPTLKRAAYMARQDKQRKEDQADD